MFEEGGGALMHVYVWEHIVSFNYRTAEWMFMKLDRNEVLMVPYKFVVFFGHICPGADPGRGEKRSQGVPIFNKLLLQTGRLHQQTNLHSNDLEACGM